MMSFEEFSLNENQKNPVIKKGEKVKVTMEFFEGAPSIEVTAYGDSDFNEYLQADSFSYLHGGDMMMTAKWDGEKWVSN